MANTHKLSVVTEAIYDLFNDPATRIRLGLSSVWYGDQERIPNTPSLCIEPGSVERITSGTAFQTTNSIKITLLVYHGQIQDSQINIRECIAFAENVADELHIDANKNLGGLLIHGWVDSLAAGVSPRAKTLWITTRLTYLGTSKTLLYS